MKKKLNVGLVGVTGRGYGYGDLFSVHPRTKITAICDTNQNNLEKAARHFNVLDSNCFKNYEDFINTDIDIVMIGTPMPYHASQSIKALANNKHVLCEVTAGTSVAECENVFEAAQRSTGKYMLAENCCYYECTKQIENIVKSGKIGDVFYAESDYVHEIRNVIIDPETGETYWRIQRPPIHYCSHSLGPLLMILDDYVVRATGSGTHSDILPTDSPGAINMQVALFETHKGRIIKLLRSSVAPGPYHLFYNMHGTKGFLETPRHVRFDKSTKGMLYTEEMGMQEIACNISNPDAPEEATMGGHGTSEYYLVRDFINAIDNNATPPIDIVKAMDFSLPGIVAHEAILQGTWLDVPHFTR